MCCMLINKVILCSNKIVGHRLTLGADGKAILVQVGSTETATSCHSYLENARGIRDVF